MIQGGIEPVASPCNSVCTIENATGYCAGCFRTLGEIAAWSEFSADQKRAVVAALAGRRRLAQERAASSKAPADAQR